MRVIRVVVVEDQTMLRDSLVAAINRELDMEVVASLADAAEAASQQNQQITRRIKVSANTANLEEYRKLAEFAKDLGATHLGADQIEPSMWQWNADRKDPYPNWSPQRPTLFKYIGPKELEKYLPADYAKRNLGAYTTTDLSWGTTPFC